MERKRKVIANPQEKPFLYFLKGIEAHFHTKNILPRLEEGCKTSQLFPIPYMEGENIDIARMDIRNLPSLS